MKEIWKDIKGYEGRYEASNYGAVRNAKTKQIRKPRVDSHGYLRINVPRNDGTGKSNAIHIHTMVALAFYKKIDGKNQVNHIDGDKKNNKVENLEWCTASENTKHAHRTGLAHVYHGEQNCNAKFNEDQVIWIRNKYKEGGISQQKMADLLGVAQTTIGRIIRGERYADIEII